MMDVKLTTMTVDDDRAVMIEAGPVEIQVWFPALFEKMVVSELRELATAIEEEQ